MRKFIIGAWVLFFGTQAIAHEMTPTYPELIPSYLDGIVSTELLLFNRREDTRYYELGVFTEEWEPVPFASQQKLIQMDYLERKTIEIFIRASDADRVVYICTTSKILKSDVTSTTVASKICSKIK